jgi:hypothetical protein
VEPVLSKGIASITALVAGCLLALAMAVPAWAVAANPQSTSTKLAVSQGHGAAHSIPKIEKITKAQIHPMPKASPQAVGVGLTPLCVNDVGIILFQGSYTCMNDGRIEYNTSGDPEVKAVATFFPGRVWLHQSATYGGGSYCVSPNMTDATLYTYVYIYNSLGSVQLSNSDATCSVNGAYAVVCAPSSYEYAAWNSNDWRSGVQCAEPGNPSEDPANVVSGILGLDNWSDHRMWLQGSGFSDCADPQTFYAVTGRDSNPTNLQFTDNPDPC